MKNLTYGQALLAVKTGKLIARAGWNGKDMFVFMRPSDEIPVSVVVNQVKSLPQSVKEYFKKKHPVSSEQEDKIKFLPYLCMKAADDSIVNGWLASQTDMLSEDWQIIEP